MTVGESLDNTVNELKKAVDEVRTAVDALPGLIRQVVAKALEDAPKASVTDEHILSALSEVTAQTKAIQAQASGINLFVQNQLTTGDPEGGVV